MAERLFHIYGPKNPHDEVWIVGNREALTALRDVLTQIIDGGRHWGSLLAFDGDGESFKTSVVEVSDSAFESLRIPYAKAEAPGGTHPFHLTYGKP